MREMQVFVLIFNRLFQRFVFRFPPKDWSQSVSRFIPDLNMCGHPHACVYCESTKEFLKSLLVFILLYFQSLFQKTCQMQKDRYGYGRGHRPRYRQIHLCKHARIYIRVLFGTGDPKVASINNSSPYSLNISCTSSIALSPLHCVQHSA